MNDQFQLWLIPPMLTAALSIWFRRKLTLEFGWPLLLQSLLIIASSASGFWLVPKPIAAVVSWILFFVFLILPNFYLKQCEHFYATLNAKELDRTCKKIKLFYWGKLGAFWHDTYASYVYYIRGDENGGDKLLAPWQAEKLPQFFQETLDATKLAAHGLLWHWDAIIAELLSRYEKNKPVSASLYLQASRAYAEKGDIEQATECLKSANLPNQRMNPRHLALTFLQYFCLTGSETYARNIIDQLKKETKPVSNLILDSWWIRCLIACGKTQEAKLLLDKTMADAVDAQNNKADTTAWIVRLQRYQSMIGPEQVIAQSKTAEDEASALAAQPAIQENIEQIWKVFQNALAVQQVVLPKRSSPAVNVLLLVMIAGYIFSGCIDLVDNPLVLQFLGPNSKLLALSTDMGTFAFKQFYLEKGPVIAGQYYRLVTYLFLHGNLSHLLLNAVGLAWFGRIAANTYGSLRFLIIFFLSGIAGGLAQIAFSDISAVGASGAIFGIFSAVAVSIFKLRGVLPEQMRKRELRWMILMTIAQVGLDRIIPHVAGLAHLGGLVAGFILGILLFPKQELNNEQNSPDK